MTRSKRDRSVALNDEQWEALADIAKAEDRPVSYLIRLAVSEFLLRHTDATTYVNTPDGPRIVSEYRGLPLPPETEILKSRGSDPQTLVEQGIEETAPVPPNQKQAEPEDRPPTDEEARLIRESFPHLKDPKVKR